MQRMIKFLLVTALILVTAACANSSRQLYYWGSYETLIYQMYNKPGTADPATQIGKLTEDINRASEKGLRVPPGVHAHLGMMYAMQGNAAQSQTAFLQEKALFPESAVLVDGMMQRAAQLGAK